MLSKLPPGVCWRRGGGGGGATGLLNKGGGSNNKLWNFHRYFLVYIIIVGQLAYCLDSGLCTYPCRLNHLALRAVVYAYGQRKMILSTGTMVARSAKVWLKWKFIFRHLVETQLLLLTNGDYKVCIMHTLNIRLHGCHCEVCSLVRGLNKLRTT